MPTGIEWCDETINPQGWGCYGPGGTPDKPQRCWYCYVERQAKGPYVPDCPECRALVPHWHVDRLMLPYRWRKPRRIFWQSMGDLFHHYTPTYQIAAVLSVVRATPQHTHIFCTKNPARYADFNPWPENCILLTSITGHPDLRKEEHQRIGDLVRAKSRVLGLSMEPLLGPVDLTRIYYSLSEAAVVAGPVLGNVEYGPFSPRYRGKGIDWIIIGAYTGKDASRFVPATDWVDDLIDQGRAAGVAIFLKNNLKWPEKIQEWPGGAIR